MKFYYSEIEPCSQFKCISFLEVSKGRSLFGLYYGYLCIFYIRFTTKWQFINIKHIEEAINTCSVSDLTELKLITFLNRPLTLKEKINYFLKWKNFNKNRKDL